MDQILQEAGLVPNVSTAEMSEAALLEEALQSALPEYAVNFDPIKEVCINIRMCTCMYTYI